MGLTPFMPFKPIGFAHNLVQFETKSWTGGPDSYEVAFDLNDRCATCSCMDSTCRKKNYYPIGDPRLCKHSRLASQILWPILARALEAI